MRKRNLYKVRWITYYHPAAQWCNSRKTIVKDEEDFTACTHTHTLAHKHTHTHTDRRAEKCCEWCAVMAFIRWVMKVLPSRQFDCFYAAFIVIPHGVSALQCIASLWIWLLILTDVPILVARAKKMCGFAILTDGVNRHFISLDLISS